MFWHTGKLIWLTLRNSAWVFTQNYWQYPGFSPVQLLNFILTLESSLSSKSRISFNKIFPSIIFLPKKQFYLCLLLNYNPKLSLGQRFIQLNFLDFYIKNQPHDWFSTYFYNFSNSSLSSFCATCGLAWPLVAFMSWPIRDLAAFLLPPL